MNFLKKILICGVTFASALLFSISVRAESRVIKIAFAGDPHLGTAVAEKIFGKGKILEYTSNVYGIRPITSDDAVLYQFRCVDLNKERLERAALSECNVVFMVSDFSPGKSNVDDITKRSFSDVRGASSGKKVILIAINTDFLSARNLSKIDEARDYYEKENFDYILVPSTQDDETFRRNFFGSVDEIISWGSLSSPTGDDLAVLRRLDPVGTIVSKFFGEMVGLSQFKGQMREIIARIMQDKRDAERGKSYATRPLYHMVITGNPGTGKTTIARKMADVLHEAGIIPTNKFTQVERKDLVGQYIGDTEKQVEKILKSAEGGVLFIDEAYSLAGGGERDFGKHVIEGLLTAMTDNRCIIITAGYPDKMQQFIDSNEGLDRRFMYRIDIPDYSEQDLFAIFKNLVSKNGLALQPAEEQRIQDLFVRYFQEEKSRLGKKFGNAGSVEKFFGLSKNQRAIRLSQCPGVLEDFITLEDVMSVIHDN